MPGPQLTAISFLRFNPQGRDSSLPHTSPPPQASAAARGLAALRPHIKPMRRAGCPHPAETYRHIPFTVQFVGDGFIPPAHLPPPQTATAARGLAALRPHIKPVRRAGCPHPAETYRHIPFPHRRPVGAGHARPAAYRHILFTIQSVGEGFIPPGHFPPPQTATAARGLAALRPRLKTHA